MLNVLPAMKVLLFVQNVPELIDQLKFPIVNVMMDFMIPE